MTQAIGVRLPKEVLMKIEEFGKAELEDRSTVLRRAVMQGMKELLANKAAQDYLKGKITLSEAARKAEMTLWEMEKYLVDNGFKSSYSVEDLGRELRLL
ncbi:MAG TPA: UPF0175 family protein [Candidatus Nanoarchaeia archaeon]|nr:UPF0175 family protein [Candidatus Nanoarchaeia archaeon]